MFATSLQSALKTLFDAAQAQLQAVCTSNDNQAAFLILFLNFLFAFLAEFYQNFQSLNQEKLKF